jgi:hypothetical protein
MLIARSIPIYCQFVLAGETADLFHSFAPVGNELICAFRRHKIVDFAEWGAAPNFYESRIMRQPFDVQRGTATSPPEEVMTMGEDPRCISVQGRPFLLSANPCGANFNYILFDIESHKCLNVELTNRPGFKYGKNWQPFVADGKLFAVHSFSPFRILRIDIETGMAEIVFERSVGLDAISPHDNYTHFRGGCSALVLEDKVVGFGHVTIDSGRHSLFRWTFCPSRGEVDLSFDLDVRPLTDWGLKIVDPTCFFNFQGKYYLGVSCSNRDWFYGQTFVSLLLELQWEPIHHAEKVTLHSVLNSELPVPLAPHSGTRAVHYFRAAELAIGQGIRSRNFEVLSRAGKDAPGHVIYGPYIDLSAGRYQGRLQYAGKASSSQEIGEVDICSASGSNVLAKRRLTGTDDKLSIVALDFDVPSEAQGRGIEVRVGSTSVADMRLTDVSISRL